MRIETIPRLVVFLFLFLAAALAGCRKAPEGQAGAPGKGGTVTAAAQPAPPTDRPAAALPQSRELDGVRIAERREGPWIVRSAVMPSGRGDMRAEAGPPCMPTMPMAKSEAMAPPPAAAAAPGAPREAAQAVQVTGGAEQGQTPLRAGVTDDNADFGKFLAFLAEWSERPAVAGQSDRLDVRGRRFVQVTDEQGAPVPGATVRVVAPSADKVVAAGVTYGDGRVPFYPALAARWAGRPDLRQSNLLVEVSCRDARTRKEWVAPTGDLTVVLPGASSAGETIRLDVLFLVDTTGSMSDEIDRIKGTLRQVTDRLRNLRQAFDLRYAAVLYRDLGDEYVTRACPFTGDIAAFSRALQSVQADAGGDMPESVNQGLAEAVRMGWRDSAAKVVFLIGDAPPHMDYQGDIRYGASLQAALEQGIRIHAVAASGLDELGTLVWRQAAQFTRGKFIFIEYGSAAATAASHGVTGSFQSNNLDAIVFEQIREELANWGKKPARLVVTD